ncbi:MAG: glycosyl hydrolase family 28-related protein [Pseudomonadota bacterium]
MNIAITNGVDLMPPAFALGLQDWSSQNGRPGETRYDADPSGNLVGGDADFGTCLELIKTASPQKLRYGGETPVLAGAYLEVSARVKLVSGPSCAVRIAGYPGDSSGAEVQGLVTTGPQVDLTSYGQVVTVRAILGRGARAGVNMVWGGDVVFGHLGLDVVGDNGAVVRIESLSITDATAAFFGQLADWVDVVDFGAVGDGSTDDAAAFEAADQAADGRDILVPAGVYRLGSSVSLDNRVRFQGTVSMDREDHLLLRAELDINAYIDAFDSELEGLRRALQALFHSIDHESLDLKGRRFQLDEPVDVFDGVATVQTYGNRRALRNGQLSANNTAAWTPEVVTTTASYNRGADQTLLTNVVNVAAVRKGSLVEGYGVGREVYVTSVDVAAQSVRISQPLVLAGASQSYTFTRFKYLLDFSGFTRMNRFQIEDIEFLGNRRGAGILLPPDGIAWSIRDCFFARPGHRAITSIGKGCNGISIDRNQFIAFDDNELVQNRTSVAININSNDVKIRNNRAVQHRHFLVAGGGGHIVTGNHFWQDDNANPGERSAGIVLMRHNPKTVMSGNYCDNATIDITNEYDPFPDPFPGKLPYGAVSITSNIFTADSVPAWFTFIRFVPFGDGHAVDGVVITGNTFKMFDGAVIDRVESVDVSLGSLDMGEVRSLIFDENSFVDVTHRTQSPALVEMAQTTAQSSWGASLANILPFAGRALGAEGLTAIGSIETGSGAALWTMPYVDVDQGLGGQEVTVHWSTAARGRVQLRVRADKST